MTEVDQEITIAESTVEKLLAEGSVVVEREGVETPLRPKTVRYVLEEDP